MHWRYPWWSRIEFCTVCRLLSSEWGPPGFVELAVDPQIINTHGRIATMGRPGSDARGRRLMALEMRANCERCQAPLGHEDVAYCCSYECTFCEACTSAMMQRCPNCGGELVRRPRRS